MKYSAITLSSLFAAATAYPTWMKCGQAPFANGDAVQFSSMHSVIEGNVYTGATGGNCVLEVVSGSLAACGTVKVALKSNIASSYRKAFFVETDAGEINESCKSYADYQNADTAKTSYEVDVKLPASGDAQLSGLCYISQASKTSNPMLTADPLVLKVDTTIQSLCPGASKPTSEPTKSPEKSAQPESPWPTSSPEASENGNDDNTDGDNTEGDKTEGDNTDGDKTEGQRDDNGFFSGSSTTSVGVLSVVAGVAIMVNENL